jgi:hypothetical protein
MQIEGCSEASALTDQPANATDASDTRNEGTLPHAPNPAGRNLDIRAASSAALHCSDLRFVSTVADIITAVRRPFTLGNCIVCAQSTSAMDAIYAASRYLNARSIMLSHDITVNSMYRELLMAVRSVLIDGVPVVITATQEVTEQEELMLVLQEFLLQQDTGGFLMPENLLDIFGKDMEGMLALVDTLAPAVDISRVRYILFVSIIHGLQLLCCMARLSLKGMFCIVYYVSRMKGCLPQHTNQESMPRVLCHDSNCSQLYPQLGLVPKPGLEGPLIEHDTIDDKDTSENPIDAVRYCCSSRFRCTT